MYLKQIRKEMTTDKIGVTSYIDRMVYDKLVLYCLESGYVRTNRKTGESVPNISRAIESKLKESFGFGVELEEVIDRAIKESFNIELINSQLDELNSRLNLLEREKKLIEAVLYFDGGSRGNPGLSAGGAYLVVEYKGLDKIHREIHKEGLLIENATNNEAEYTGLIVGLQKALELGVTNLKVFGDSQLIINHVKGSWTCRQPHLQELLNQVKLLVKQFDEIDLEWIPRSGNKKADEICNRLMDEYSGLVPEPIVEVELTEPKQPSNKLHRLVLRMLNKKQRSFKDMANLKVNGKDEFSYKKLSELSEMLTKDELFALSEEWLKRDIVMPNEKYLAVLYRWFLRLRSLVSEHNVSLSAIANFVCHKVRVDAEIATNATGSDVLH